VEASKGLDTNRRCELSLVKRLVGVNSVRPALRKLALVDRGRTAWRLAALARHFRRRLEEVEHQCRDGDGGVGADVGECLGGVLADHFVFVVEQAGEFGGGVLGVRTLAASRRTAGSRCPSA
jgi:hypothetical protein